MTMAPMSLSATLKGKFARPSCVVELVALGALLSAAILILTSSSAALFLTQEGSEAMPLFYILLAAASIPLASWVSTALSRCPTIRVCRTVCLAAAALGLALWALL